MDATEEAGSEAQRRLAGLLAAGDLDAMVAACGGFSATLADIAAALRFISGQRHPDLGAALGLAFARDELLRWNAKIPAELPMAWVRLGQPERADDVSRTLSDVAGVRCNVLISLADTAFAAGDSERGLRLAGEVEKLATYSGTLCVLAVVLARAGELGWARRLVDEAEVHAGLSGKPLSGEVVKARIAVGQRDRVEAIMRQHGRHAYMLLALAGTEDDPERRRELVLEAFATLRAGASSFVLRDLFGSLAKAMIDIGEEHRLVEVAKDLAHDQYADREANLLVWLGNMLAGAGDLSGAALLLAEARAVDGTVHPTQRLIDQEAWGVDPDPSAEWYELMIRVGETPEIKSEWYGMNNISRVADAMVRVGDVEQAEAVVRRAHGGTEWQARAFATLASRAAGAGDLDRGRRLAAESEALARTLVIPMGARPELIALAMAEAGDLEQAEAAARSISQLVERLMAFAKLSGRSARAGDLDRARRLVREALEKINRITGQRWQADRWDLWTEAVRACAELGDPALAEEAGRVFSSKSETESVITRLAEAWIRVGDLEAAESTARRITTPQRRCKPLTEVAQAWIEAGDLARAEAVALDLPDAPADLLVALVKARAAAGDLDRAEVIARGAVRPAERARVLIALAEESAGTGDVAALVGEAVAAARAVTPEIERFRALQALIRPLGGLGERERLAQVTTETLEVVRALPYPHNLNNATATLVSLAATLAEAGELDRALDILVPLVGPPVGSPSIDVLRTLTAVADRWAAAGDFDRANDVLAHDPQFHRPETLAVLATTAFRAGDRERAGRLLDEAEAVARAHPAMKWRYNGLVQVATGWVRAGDPEKAEAVVRSIASPRHLGPAWETLARALVAAGEPERAEALVPAVTHPERRARLIEALAEAGGPGPGMRGLLAAALVDTPAKTILPVLAKVDPAAVIAAATGHGGIRRPDR